MTLEYTLYVLNEEGAVLGTQETVAILKRALEIDNRTESYPFLFSYAWIDLFDNCPVDVETSFDYFEGFFAQLAKEFPENTFELHIFGDALEKRQYKNDQKRSQFGEIIWPGYGEWEHATTV